jgi:hypothetical protein
MQHLFQGFHNFGKNLAMKNPIHSIRDYWNRKVNKPLFASMVVFFLALIGIIIYDLIGRS